ncbi:hypothetical protein Ae201684P_005739 [Aphanomyces euteiches]|nr:hypothetical protein Ae201684P_005227 [Aphanomyces euteiches]KAH9085965.1 hypothetical protein Ae201684P_005661 [Aphanomyces euteiches]KAH9086043.1 hypothetical protein Ae201684P_005739 [Aphanomyces euteiches]KAH9139200.1 hypothetical protein AeRB84_016525 [Aphanomyces euteiches]
MTLCCALQFNEQDHSDEAYDLSLGRLVQMLETASDVVLNGRKRAAIDLDNGLKKRARSRVNTIQVYEDVRWIPPTSVIVERLFSGVKCIIGYLRKTMDTTTLEVIMYLTLNWDVVSLATSHKPSSCPKQLKRIVRLLRRRKTLSQQQ